MSDYGTATVDGKTVTLTQNAYATGGSFPVPGGGMYNGEWYEAHAVDSSGHEYIVCWTDCNGDSEDESDACDWDSPNYLREI